MQWGGFTQAPFDALGDYFRGTKGVMIDMYRRPDKLIRTCERLLPMMLEAAQDGFKGSGNPRIFMPLHKGLDGFMSLEQFKRFFWPTLKELMTSMIDHGMIPCPFWEGDCTSRLDIIKDIPAGKALYKFESTNLVKAKEILGDRVCIRGGMPISVLITGTPEDIKEHCKSIIKTVGKDGGFIMDASTGLDDVSPENVRAFFDYTREYGAYQREARKRRHVSKVHRNGPRGDSNSQGGGLYGGIAVHIIRPEMSFARFGRAGRIIY